MKKYEEMIEQLNEDSKRIVLNAMEQHDKHYKCLVSVLKKQYLLWQEISKIMVGVHEGFYEDYVLFEYLSDHILESRGYSGNWDDLAWAIGEGGTVASIMWEKYNNGKNGVDLRNKIMDREFEELCDRIGVEYEGDEVDYDYNFDNIEISQRTKGDLLTLSFCMDIYDEEKSKFLNTAATECKIKEKG